MDEPDPTTEHDEEDVARILASDSTAHGPGFEDEDELPESDTDEEVEA